MTEKTEYKIVDLVKKNQHIFKGKFDTLSLLLNLKNNIEFNSSFSYLELFKELGELFKDYKPLYQHSIYTPDPIDVDDFGPNDVFVFGSNTQGEHAGGAAKAAVNIYGAILGQPRGLQGQSYAIVTLDYTEQEPVTLETIETEIDEFLKFAVENPELRFWMTKIGTGISGYQLSDIAKLFYNKIIPANVILPHEFVHNFINSYFYCERLGLAYKIEVNKRIIVVNTNQDSMAIDELPYTIIASIPEDIIEINENSYLEYVETVLKELF